MFDCRVCSNTPFAYWFGFEEPPRTPKKKKKRDQKWQPRNEEEIQALMPVWRSKADPRIERLWPDEVDHWYIFRYVMDYIDRQDDPILAADGEVRVPQPDTPLDDTDCVIWHGAVDEEGRPKMTMVIDDCPVDKDVLRLLLGVFGDIDVHYLVVLKDHVDTTCGEKRCVNINHAVMPEDDMYIFNF